MGAEGEAPPAPSETPETPETLGGVGESAALARILPRLPAGDATLTGPGDDAAVLAVPDGRLVITTDTMVHGPDFRLAWSTPYDLGWKAAATNLADVAAMGARPTALVVALAAPPSTSVAFLERLADGLREGCAALAPGCGVVGGDLTSSRVLTIAVTAVGELDGRAPVLRSGARPGDAVAVAGDLGSAARGIAALFAEAVDASGEPDAELADRIRDRPDVVAQLRPSPPIAAGVDAAAAGATAMLDVSDGLLLDARRLAAASGVRIDLDRTDGAELHGGEAHALLAAFPPDAPLPPGFRAIGRVLEGAGVTVEGEAPAGRGGWDPYADWDGATG